MKKRHNLEKKTKTLEVVSAGVRVRIRVDGDGRPLYSIPVYNAGHPQDERFVELAAKVAHNAASGAAQRNQNKDSLATATDTSAKNRTKASKAHSSNHWFDQAHKERPEFGKQRLAQRARQLASTAGIPETERDKITVDRAQQFLNRQRDQG